MFSVCCPFHSSVNDQFHVYFTRATSVINTCATRRIRERYYRPRHIHDTASRAFCMCVSRVAIFAAVCYRLKVENIPGGVQKFAGLMQVTQRDDGVEHPPAEALPQCSFSADAGLLLPPPLRKIPESALSAIRGILVSSLYQDVAPVPPAHHVPREVSSSPSKRAGRHVTFESSTADDGYATGTSHRLLLMLIIL